MSDRAHPAAPARPAAWGGPPHLELGVLHAFGPARLRVLNRQLYFHGAGDRRLQFPLRSLRLVMIYGSVDVTAPALKRISESGAALATLSADGRRTYGVLMPAADAGRSIRFRQYEALRAPAWCLEQARRIVRERLASQTGCLEFERRQGRASARVRQRLAELVAWSPRVDGAPDLQTLRGIEGVGTRLWFQALADLLPPAWSLPGRVKHPPTDPVNALLSFGYVWLGHRVQAACQAWGLDPAVGVLHTPRPGRASLACDLIEPFRTPAVDRPLLRELRAARFHTPDFHPEASGAVRIDAQALRRWIAALETHLHDPGTDGRSLQVLLVDRIRRFVDDLPRPPSVGP